MPDVTDTPFADPAVLHALCREALEPFARQSAPAWLAQLDELAALFADRLTRNLSNGRPQRRVGLPPTCCPRRVFLRAYAGEMIGFYHRHHAQLVQLAASDDAGWQAVYDDLCAVARRKFAALGITGERARQDAHDAANRACELISQSPYPLDVPFKAWSRQVLLNCLRQNGRSTDPHARSPQSMLSLDAALADSVHISLHESLADRRMTADLERMDDLDELLRAIASLQSAHERVVLLATLEETDDTQIAARLGTTRANVHTLRRRAKAKLRERFGVSEPARAAH